MTSQEIIALRNTAGWTQDDLDSFLGVTSMQCFRLEHGTATLHPYQNALLRHFAVRVVDELIGRRALEIRDERGIAAALAFLLEGAYNEK